MWVARIMTALLASVVAANDLWLPCREINIQDYRGMVDVEANCDPGNGTYIKIMFPLEDCYSSLDETLLPRKRHVDNDNYA